MLALRNAAMEGTVVAHSASSTLRQHGCVFHLVEKVMCWLGLLMAMVVEYWLICFRCLCSCTLINAVCCLHRRTGQWRSQNGAEDAMASTETNLPRFLLVLHINFQLHVRK